MAEQSRSTKGDYENRWLKGFDCWDKTGVIYLIFEDSSYSKEVIYWWVGWKPRVKDEKD